MQTAVSSSRCSTQVTGAIRLPQVEAPQQCILLSVADSGEAKHIFVPPSAVSVAAVMRSSSATELIKASSAIKIRCTKASLHLLTKLSEDMLCRPLSPAQACLHAACRWACPRQEDGRTRHELWFLRQGSLQQAGLLKTGTCSRSLPRQQMDMEKTMGNIRKTYG